MSETTVVATVADQCRSCANQLFRKNTLRVENYCVLRPKFRHGKGLLDTAYRIDEESGLAAGPWMPAQNRTVPDASAFGSGFEMPSTQILEKQAAKEGPGIYEKQGPGWVKMR